MKACRFYQKILVVALLILFGGQAYAQMVLVSGTDFEVLPAVQGNTYTGVENLVYTGLLTPTLTINSGIEVAPDVNYEYDADDMPVSSHFQDGKYYAITNNPIKLDSLHYVDNAPANDWGIVFSPQRVTANTTVLQYGLNGLKPETPVRVVVHYQSVIDPTKLTSCGSGSGRFEFKLSVNADLSNLIQGEPATQIGMGESEICTVTTTAASNSTGNVKADGSVDIRINIMNTYSNDCHAFMISKIEVYGEIDPKIYCVEGAEVCAGEQVELKPMQIYDGDAATYLWYHNDAPVAGATSPSYLYEMPATEGIHTFRLDVKIGGLTVESNELTINAIKCCEINGVAASRKIVYMDDFGEFDLSDPTGETYKVWDYSDTKNPIQVTKTTTTPFRYALTPAPLGATYKATSYIDDGEYCVAGVLTRYNPVPGTTIQGAKLEWAGHVGGVEIKDPAIAYDHSGKLEGACLFINVPPNTGGQSLYSRTLDNLCSGKQLFFECYITVFTYSAPGDYNPVDITVKLTEIGNPTNVKTATATATIPSRGGTGTWVKISQQIFLEENDGIQLDIINNNNVDKNGNDLVIDDIIIRACAAPTIKAYFDLTTLDTYAESCDGADVTVFAKPSEMLTNYFGGEDKTYYLYQWTTTPTVKTSWKNVGAPNQNLTSPNLEAIFAGLESGDKVYFRVIAGTLTPLTDTNEGDFNEDDPCANYTISDAIEALVDCPACTEPKPIAITPVGGKLTGTGVTRTVNLCEGESVTLNTNDITPMPAYTAYTITWFKGDKATQAATPTNGVQSSLTVNYDDVTATGVTYYVQVVDTDFPTTTTCHKWDEIIIKANPTPDTTLIDPTLCEGVLPSPAPSLTIAGHDITWYSTIAGTGVPITAPDLASLTETQTFYYTVTNTTTGCVSAVHEYKVTVEPKPVIIDFTVDAICSGQSADLTPDAAAIGNVIPAGTTYTWTAPTITGISGASDGEDESTLSSGDLVNSTNAAIDVAFTVIPKSGGGCEGDPFTVTVKVNPKPHIANLALLNPICSGETFDVVPSGAVSGNIIPAGTTYSWSAPTAAGITNGLAPGTDAAAITGTLTNGTSAAIDVVYTVTPKSGDCEGSSFTVTVTVNPEPAITDMAAEICSGGSFNEIPENGTDGIVPSGTKYKWDEPVVSDVTGTAAGADATAIAGTLTATAEGVHSVVYSVTPTFGTCEGDEFNVTVSVEKTPKPVVKDPVSYFLSDASGNTFGKNLTQQKPDVVTAEGTNTLIWYAADGITELPGTPTPTGPFNTETNTEFTYYVSQKHGDCESDPEVVNVIVYASPTPTPNHVSYCREEGGTGAPLTAEKMLAGLTEADYVLLWYDEATGGVGSETAPEPSIDQAGVRPYYVTQKNIHNGSESLTRVQLNVTVYDVMAPKVEADKNTFAYCAGDTDIKPLFATKVEDQPDYYYADAFVWYDYDGTETGATAPVVNTNVTTTTTYTYKVKQTYTIPTTSEVCKGPDHSFEVRITSVPNPEGTFSVSYLKKEAEENGNIFDKNLLQQEPNVAKTKDCATCELVWYDESGTTEIGRGANAPTPVYDSGWPTGKDTTLIYQVAQFDTDAQCFSAKEKVYVTISDSPMPKVKPLSYCQGATADVLTAEINTDYGGSFNLVWYNGDPKSGGTAVPSVTPKTTIASGLAQETTTYYVTQKSTSSPFAESSASRILVTVYANPVLTTTAPAAVCEQEVELNLQPGVWNVSNVSPADVKTRFYQDAGATLELVSSKVKDAGKYYAQATFSVPANAVAGNEYCYSNIADIDVDIRTMEPVNIDASPTTCPDGDELMEVEVTGTGLKTLMYTWTKDGSALAGSGNSAQTGVLPGTAGDQYTFGVTVSDGVCSETDTHTITIGDGPVDGIMTVSETGNSQLPMIFNPSEDKEFFTCGTEVTIATGYTSVDNDGNPINDFVWYLGSDKVADGPDLTILDMDEYELDRTYRLEYTNKCKTSVEVTVNAVPLKITDVIVTPSMNLCEGKPFSAELKIESGEVPAVEWSTPPSVTGPKDGGILSIAATQYDHSGIYNYVVTNRGCKEEGSLGMLNVSGAISFTMSDIPVICAGNEVEVKLDTVTTSEGNMPELMWRDPLGAFSTIEGRRDTLSINAIPPFTASNADENRRSTYFYTVVAVNSYCSDSILVPVYVDEPLSGSLSADSPICEGERASLDASSFGASAYVWTSSVEDGMTLMPVDILSVAPDTTTTFYVEMTRGICSKRDSISVTVTTLPRILRIDSVDVRVREIIADENFGTPPFSFRVDGKPFDGEPIKYDLSFGMHNYYILDANGCQSNDYRREVAPPKLIIPGYFSPNGDNTNDTWVIGNIGVYPDAVVTIFDRFGKQLVQYNSNSQSWDGKYLGKEMPATDYWYVIDVEEIDKQYVGHFTLLRK